MNKQMAYLNRTGRILYDMPLNGVLELNKPIPEEQRQKFIESVKWYIDRDIGIMEGFYIEFNNDTYSKIKKIKR